MSKRMQARVVECGSLRRNCVACSTVKCACVKEVNRLRRFMDRINRYLWSRKTKPPLFQMQEEGKNMFDVRKELGVLTMRWKLKKRVLERIGHVMRMDDSRMTKASLLDGRIGKVRQAKR